MSKKILIIFWGCKNLPLYTSYETTDKNGRLYCLPQHIDVDDHEWKSYLQSIIAEHTNAAFLIMLHEEKGFSSAEHQKIKNHFEKGIFRKFYGGKEFIYFDDQTNSGLFWNGYLVKDMSFIDPENDSEEENDKEYTIFDQNENILTYYFDPVWRHYYHAPKRKLFETQEHLIRELAIQDSLPNLNLYDYIAQNNLNTLKQYVNHHITLEEVKKGTEDQANQSQILEAHQALLDHLNISLGIPNYLDIMNQHFIKVINLIPGPIY